MPYDVFISHKSNDKEALTKIENFLDSKGINYWSDTKLVEGLDWMRQIDTALKNSRILLVLLSRHTIEDPYNMESELNLATKKRMKFVVVKLDDTSIDDYSGGFSLYLQKVQWIDANNNVDLIYDSLYLAIKAQLETSENKKMAYENQMQEELIKLKEKQALEVERRINDRVRQSIVKMNAATVENLIKQGNYYVAMNKLNEFLITDNAWELLELKVKCVTKNYTIYPQRELSNIYKELKQANCPQEELERICNDINGVRESIRRKEELERRRKEFEEEEEKRKKIEARKIEIQETKDEISEINNDLKRNNISYIVRICLSFLLLNILLLIFFNGLSNLYIYLIIFNIGLLGCFIKQGFLSFLCYIALLALFPYFYIIYSSFYSSIELENTLIYPLISNLKIFILNFYSLFGLEESLYSSLSVVEISLVFVLLLTPYLIANYLSIPHFKRYKSRFWSFIGKLFLLLLMVSIGALVLSLIGLLMTDNQLYLIIYIVVSYIYLLLILLLSTNFISRGEWIRNIKYKKIQRRNLIDSLDDN